MNEYGKHPPTPAEQHLDEMTCLLYVERQLDRARAQEVSAHSEECDACRTLLRALDRESRLLTRAMYEEDDEPLPARLAHFQQRARRSLQWIWAASFGLAATGIYALYTTYVQPMQQQFEQAGFGGSNLLGVLIFQGAFWKGWQSMITLLEVLALLTVAGFAVLIFRRRIRRGSSALAVLFAALSLAFLMQPVASATEFRKGQSPEVTKDETIKGDLYITGEHVRVEGTVDGDLYVFCKEADIYGHVTGDVIGFAQGIHIYGQVDGNARVAMNNFSVSGTVNKNVSAFGDSSRIEGAGKVGGSMSAFGGGVDVNGQLGRDLLFMGGMVDISGKIDGSVQAKGQSLTISSTAQVNGPVNFEGEKEPDVSSSAKLASPVQFKKHEHKPEYYGSSYYIWRVIWTAAFVLFGLVLYRLMPKLAFESTASGEDYGPSLGLGVLVVITLPIASAIACVTVVGIPLGVLGLLLWILLMTCAQIVVGTVIGKWMLGKPNDIWDLIGRMAAGLVVLRVAVTITNRIPIVGTLVKLGICVWGLGAISLAIYRQYQRPGVQGAVAAPVAAPLPPNTTVGGAQPA